MAQGIKSQARPANGGTYAPPGAAKSPSTGIGNARVAPKGTGIANNQPVPKAPTPSAAPAAPAAGTSMGTPLPWDAAYESSVNNANTKLNNAGISIGEKRGLLQQEYGLDAGFNDYKANPYSRAALLEQSYQRANRASGNSLALAGQLYSGASQNAETYNREHNGQERSSLEGLYRSALQSNSDEKVAAENLAREEKNAALWKSIEAAGSAELEPETAPAGGSSGGASGGTVKRATGPGKNAKATPQKPIDAKAFNYLKKGKK